MTRSVEAPEAADLVMVAELTNHIRAELAEKRDIALTYAEAELLMAEYDRRGQVELGHE
jgi:hypothetical protein